MPESPKKARKLAASVAKVLDFPLDALSHESVIDVTGNGEARIFSCRSISDFSPELVVVNCRNSRISIKGEGLVISDFVGNSITVSGKIFGIAFDEVKPC